MNLAIILDITFGGYGVAKALRKYNIPMIGFVHENNSTHYEAKTKLCAIRKYNNNNLLNQLIFLGKSVKEKPVVYFSSDVQVEFFINNIEVLTNYYLFNLPTKDILIKLLYKNTFHTIADKYNLNIPKTYSITKLDDLHNIPFPIFIKPMGKWSNTTLKGLLCDSYMKATKQFQYSTRLVGQEWIPGSSEDIISVFVYYDKHSKCISNLACKKIREWPIINGTGSCLGVVNDDDAINITIQFFNNIKYRGFGMLELKRHVDTGKLYAIEPTVGRVDLNSEIVVINGLNFPAIHYSQLTGIYLKNMIVKNTKNRYWIHDEIDIYSIISHIKNGTMDVKTFIKTYSLGKFHFLNIYDPFPFISLLKTMIVSIFKKGLMPLYKNKKTIC